MITREKIGCTDPNCGDYPLFDGYQLMAIACFLFAFSLILLAIHIAFGADFHFNLTKQMIDEGRLLDICINTDIKIPNCNMITGKVNSSYGEALP